MKTKNKRVNISIPAELYSRFLAIKATKAGATNPQAIEAMIEAFERSQMGIADNDETTIAINLDNEKKEDFFAESPFADLVGLELTEQELFDKACNSTDKPKEWWLIPAVVRGCKEIIISQLKADNGFLAANAKGAADNKISKAWDQLIAAGKPFRRQQIRELTGSNINAIKRWIETYHPEIADQKKFNA